MDIPIQHSNTTLHLLYVTGAMSTNASSENAIYLFITESHSQFQFESDSANVFYRLGLIGCGMGTKDESDGSASSDTLLFCHVKRTIHTMLANHAGNIK